MANQFVPPNGIPTATPVGTDGTTLATIISSSDGAVQAAGGDASATIVKASGSTTARKQSDRAADMLYVQDFGPDGTAAGDTAAFIAADTAAANGSEAAILNISPGTTINGDGSSALFGANHTIVTGRGTLDGFLRKQANCEYLPTPWMFPPTVTANNLKRTHVAAASGKIRLVVMGDSIFNRGANIISQAAMPIQILVDEIEKQNPGVEVELFDYTIGGKNWGDMWSDTAQPPAWYDNNSNLNWKQFVAAANPDLLFLYSGGNDGFSFDVTAFQDLVAYFQTASTFSSGNIPDLLFGITYQPSIGSTTLNYDTLDMQNGIVFCSTYIRNYAITYGYGYLDFGRWHAMCRDGIDPREVTLAEVQPTAGTTLPAWDTLVAVDSNKNWYFPDATAKSGVNASSCTDWILAFTCSADPGFMQIPMSNRNGDGSLNSYMYILNKNGYIYVTVSDGVSGDKIANLSNIPWPTGESVWTIMVQDGRAVVWFQNGLTNGWGISGQDNIRMGMGMEIIFDHRFPRFGAPYSPHINFGNAISVSVQTLCVGDVTNIQSSGHWGTAQRFRPIVSDYELYVEDDSYIGGSGAYHMNAYGVRIILAPVIRAQQWGAPSLSSHINTITSPQGWLQVNDPIKTTGYLTSGDFISAGNSVTCWGAAALASQPTLTLTSPTANETAIANVLVSYGMVKLVSS